MMLGFTVLTGRAFCASLTSLSCVVSRRFYLAKRKRFFKNVGIVKSEGKFEVCLDQRKLKTPLGNHFTVPNEALAVAVATEWDAQLKEINQHEMHLETICARKRDMMLGFTVLTGRAFCASLTSLSCVVSRRFYPAKRKRFFKNVGIVKSEGKFEVCLDQRKLKTPLGNHFTVPNEALAVAVATEWDAQLKEINQHEMHLTTLCNTVLDNPSHKTEESLAAEILEFLESDTVWHGVKLDTWSDLASSSLPEETSSAFLRHLLSYSLWGLTGLLYATESLKSAVLCMAAVSRVVDVDQAVSLSRLETEFQTSRWGSVEWAHDLDREQLRSRVAAALLFVQLTGESSSTVHKATAAKA
ncbi:hypothetical protein IscW_ISCW019217 [Ixodes scapularis]|uniref:Uncharacterized protein n=1 Tax=Ixodes scapularis TaxID=6945 RepID=B7PPV4_IXOSC|nr:hypothetical protein IscW_ISCW019217 [Ixodes scapularis]|eukprot:XP_002435796.1 hypothetical protein IscW_ISCW019217 [Ixodes scapularis]